MNKIEVKILSAENVKVNVLSGIVHTSDADPYEGPYTTIPKAHNETILETKNKILKDNIKVLKIPYWETSNISGKTVYIANEL